EFFEILTSKQLCRHNKPIAVYNIDGFYNELDGAIRSAIKKNFIKERCLDLYKMTENVDEIFNHLTAPVKEVKTVKELKDG
ncbi:MAG: LOG family protein, partial [Monoglobaceae bacterium]